MEVAAMENRHYYRRRSDIEAQKWRERFISAMLALSFTLTVMIMENSFDCRKLKDMVISTCYQAIRTAGN